MVLHGARVIRGGRWFDRRGAAGLRSAATSGPGSVAATGFRVSLVPADK